MSRSTGERGDVRFLGERGGEGGRRASREGSMSLLGDGWIGSLVDGEDMDARVRRARSTYTSIHVETLVGCGEGEAEDSRRSFRQIKCGTFPNFLTQDGVWTWMTQTLYPCWTHFEGRRRRKISLS